MGWIEVVNKQATRLSSLERILGTVFLRQVLLAEARHALGPHPHESFRGIVEDRIERQGTHYLVVRPEGLTEQASQVIPNLLVPCDRALYPGSVVKVSAELEDPDLYDASEGVIAKKAQVQSVLGVER